MSIVKQFNLYIYIYTADDEAYVGFHTKHSDFHYFGPIENSYSV